MKSLRISSVEIDLITPTEALEQIKSFLSSDKTNFVLTPNAGQLTTYRNDPDLRSFLSNSQLRLIDGWPLALAATIAEGKTCSRVTGSDLLPKLFENLAPDTRVGIIGGASRFETEAKLKALYPNLNLTLVNDEEFLTDDQNAKKISELCKKYQINLLVLGLGHPKQELLASKLVKYPVDSLKVVLCFGASVDFIIGKQKRAPKLLQKIGLEWFYRLITNPKRFLRRYLNAIWPSLVLITSALRIRFF